MSLFYKTKAVREVNIKTLTLMSFVVIVTAQFAHAQTEPVTLWPGGAPGVVGTESQDIPTITPFLAPKEKTSGGAIIVLPGGGYSHLSDIKEGSDVAKWLNSLGITAFVLKYRLGMRYHAPTQEQDAARAVRIVRARASEWNVDPSRIGVLGFSAGGHLAATIGTHFDAGNAAATDPPDRVTSRPDVMILIYPVITMGQFAHAGSKKYLLGDDPSAESIKNYSNELWVTKETPPTFLAHAVADPGVPVENTLLFAEALRKAGVPFEMHLYEKGPHGFGLAPSDPVLATWTKHCADWLGIHGFTQARSSAAKK